MKRDQRLNTACPPERSLWVSVEPNISHEEVVALLEATTDHLIEASGTTCPPEQQGGAGRLNVTKSVNRPPPSRNRQGW